MQFTLLSVLDYAGVAMFAASGALMAAQKRQDVVTFIFFAAITGVGGGTLRDLLIDAPVFWVLDPGYVIVCTVVAVLVFLMGRAAIHLGVPLDPFSLTVIVLVAALPSASNTALLAERFGANSGRIARVILVSTALAFFSFSGAVTVLT